jgi:hypothetical protein
MANLIRKIAISSSNKLRGGHQPSGNQEFMYFSSSGGGTHGAVELSSQTGDARTETTVGGIRKTEEIRIKSTRKTDEASVDVEVISTPSTTDPSNLRGSADGDDERPIRYETWNSSGLKK